MTPRGQTWLEHLKETGRQPDEWDIENGGHPAELMPDYEPPPAPAMAADAPGPSPAAYKSPISEAEILGAGGGAPSSSDGPPIPGLHAASPRNGRLARAARLDRKRQNEDDLMMLLLAAGRRETPHLRNLGTPQQDSIRGEEDPEKRDLELARLKKLLEPKPGKPVDGERRALELDALRALIGQRKAPKKATGAPSLTPEQRAYWEGIAGKPLPPDATTDDVNRLGGFVRSENSLQQSHNQFGTKLSEERSNKRDEEQRRQEGMEIPGRARDAKVRTSGDEVNRLRNAEGDVDALEAAIDKLQGAIRKYGVVVNPKAEGYAELEARLGDVQLKSKGPAAYALGVLAGPDVGFLQKLSGDPTSIRGWAKGPEDALTRLGVAKESARAQLEAKMKANGYGGRTRAQPGKVLMRLGDDIRWFDPSVVEKKKTEGWALKGGGQ